MVMRRRRYDDSGWAALFARSEYEVFVVGWEEFMVIVICVVGNVVGFSRGFHCTVMIMMMYSAVAKNLAILVVRDLFLE
jgi:hypothetical protein